MAYIGKQPVVGNFVKLDAITTSATTTFNLTNGGVAYFPQTANNCIVSLNGVIQSPTSAYTISGSTIIFSDALTSSDTIDFILVLGDVLSIGTPSDGTVTSAKLASGVSGLISWQSVQTTGFTAVAGRGYPCNTTSSAFTVTLPASATAGDTIILVDYAGTFATNNVTLERNGLKIEGGTANKILTTNREAVSLTYVDSTQGWVASSGANEGTQSIDPITYSIDFLVVAGGAGGGVGDINNGAGGGGAGGFRTSTQTVNSGTVITVTVGDGGTVGASNGNQAGGNGSNSSISGSGLTTITSAGGGGGSQGYAGTPPLGGQNGGSGGGGGGYNNGVYLGGSGNTPSTSPSQGNNGGNGANSGSTNTTRNGGGGGGASAVGGTGTSPSAGNGGAGTASSITGSSVTYAGGGGGCGSGSSGTPSGSGGSGGGGAGTYSGTAGSGTANLGGGGGGAGSGTAGTGGKGVVILSVPTAKYTSTTTGSPTVTTSGSNTILTFTGSGSYTA